jgi:hypothetical protein
VLIVEGPDCSGKSFLAAALGRVMGVEVVHAGGPPVSRLEFVERLSRQLSSRGKILDRCAVVSERVYGTVLRDETIIPEEGLRLWTKNFVDDGWSLVYCRLPDPVTLERMRLTLVSSGAAKSYKTGQHIAKILEHAPDILRAYDRVIAEIERAGMPVVRYNYLETGKGKTP